MTLMWLSQAGNLYCTLPTIFGFLQSHYLFLLILIFSKSLSHVILLSLRVLESGGKICPLCPNLTADHRSSMLSLSDTGLCRIENSGSLPLPLLGCLGRWERDHTTISLAITNHACLVHMLSMITMHANNLWRPLLLINLSWMFHLSVSICSE